MFENSSNKGTARPAAPWVPLVRLACAFRERILTTAVSIVVNLIVRRDETAAMRSQANTAKLLQDNPTLMRLRELEVLEKVAASAKLNVVIGEKGLTERVVNML